MQLLFQMISKIVGPLVVGLFDTNISQCSCLMDNPSSQLVPYTPPNDYKIYYSSYNPPNKPTLIIEVDFFLVYHIFDDSSSSVFLPYFPCLHLVVLIAIKTQIFLNTLLKKRLDPV